MNKDLYFIYNTFDRDIQYRGFKFTPVNMSKYYELNSYADCLLLEKDFIPDEYKSDKTKIVEYVKIMQMNDLDFLFRTSNNENQYIGKFFALLSLCTNVEIDKFWCGFDKNEKAVFTYNDEIYNSDDYTKIQEIISNQNDIELIDYRKSKGVRDAEKKGNDYKKRGKETANLEEMMVSIAIFTGWTIKEINEMTIRKFMLAISRADMLLHYKVYLSASMSGMVEFKDKSFIKHWLTTEKKADLAMVDLSTVSAKMKSA